MTPDRGAVDRLGCDIYRTLPLETLETLDRYLEAGIWPGDALGAVLANDLQQTFARGDEGFIRHLPVLLRYLFNRVPSGAWGTDERIAWWCNIAGREGRESYLRHYESHREYMARRRQQSKDFAASCRDNDKQ